MPWSIKTQPRNLLRYNVIDNSRPSIQYRPGGRPPILLSLFMTQRESVLKKWSEQVFQGLIVEFIGYIR